jgi:dTDP-4-dehydrorhamnose reductase
VRALIIGADTPIGLALVEQLEQREWDCIELPKADCRWKSERQAKKSLRRSDADFVVDTRLQAAADGGIRIHDVDVERTRWLARASHNLKLPYFYLSTARVFAGGEERPYREDDYPDGESAISKLLIAAEASLRDHCERHVIVRLGPVFAPTGINVMTHMLGQLQAGESMQLGRRQLGCPLSAADAARSVTAMLDQFSCGVEAWGIYHYCSPDITSCYEFAEVLLASASQYQSFANDAVELLSEPDMSTVSRSLDCSKIKNTFAIKQQPWRVNVAGQVKQFYAELKKRENSSGEGNRHHDTSA